MKDKKVLDSSVLNSQYNSNQIINSVLKVPGAAFNGGSEIGKLSTQRSALMDKVRSGLASGSDIFGAVSELKGKYDVADYYSKEGMALANLIDIALSPYVSPDLKAKYVYPELNKVNAYKASKGQAQIDLPGVNKSNSSNVSAAIGQAAAGPSIEDQVANILNQLTTTLSTGSKSVTEDDMMYKRRIDEQGKLRTRGIVNALQGLPVLSVGNVELKAPTLGGK